MTRSITPWGEASRFEASSRDSGGVNCTELKALDRDQKAAAQKD